MSSIDLIEGNKLLAEFIGFCWLNDSWIRGPLTMSLRSNVVMDDHGAKFVAEYDTSWEHLMRIVDKIEATFNKEGLRPFVLIGTTFVRIDSPGQGEPIEKRIIDGESKILALYDVCVEFVKQYNKAKQDEG